MKQKNNIILCDAILCLWHGGVHDDTISLDDGFDVELDDGDDKLDDKLDDTVGRNVMMDLLKEALWWEVGVKQVYGCCVFGLS